MKGLLERIYPESRFGGYSDVDGTVAFYGRIHALIDPTSVVLDVGCGRGAGLLDDPIAHRRKLRTLRGRCAKVIGIDVDAQAAANPGVDEFHLLEDRMPWPIRDASVDLVVSDFVLEHVEEPERYFSELVRVLKPGGIYCARTSNRVGYVGLFARMIPNRRHAGLLRHLQSDRESIDVFPTRYRVNTVWALRRALAGARLDGVAYGYEAEPSYLGFTSWAYAFGKVLHVLTPSPFRTCLFVFARKPMSTAG